MLRKKDIDYIAKRKALPKTMNRSKDFKIRNRIKRNIKQLIWIMENCDEKQLTLIFNEDTMRPFFKKLFNLTPENRNRLLELWQVLLLDVANENYIQILIGRQNTKLLMWQQHAELLSWLYAVAMSHKSEK